MNNRIAYILCFETIEANNRKFPTSHSTAILRAVFPSISPVRDNFSKIFFKECVAY